MKKYLFLFIVTLNAFLSIAQTNYEDVVFLKNGSIIHGIIIEQVPNESIKIKSGQNIFVYKISEVQKMTKEEIASSPSNNNNSQIAKVTYDEKGMEVYLKKKLETESGGALEFIDFKKTDGASKILDGQNWYTLYFTFTFQPKVTVYKSGNSGFVGGLSGYWKDFKIYKEKLGGWDAMLESPDGQKEYKQNQPIKLSGITELFKTETGWKISTTRFNKEELLGSTEINQIEEEKIARVNSDLNNSSSNYEYNEIEKRNYIVASIPNLPDATIEVSKIDASQTNFNITELQNNIISEFERSKRFESTNKSRPKNIITYEFTINRFTNEYSQGKKLFSNEPYAGYSCMLNFTYTISDENRIIKKETIGIQGGDFMLSTPKDKANDECLKNFTSTIKNIIYFYNPISCNFINVESSDKKGFPKLINIDNGKYFDSDMNVYFAIVEPNNISYSQGELKYTNAIATCELKKVEGENINCKILSGEQNLKTYIDSGKKFIAVSSIKKLPKVE